MLEQKVGILNLGSVIVEPNTYRSCRLRQTLFPIQFTAWLDIRLFRDASFMTYNGQGYYRAYVAHSFLAVPTQYDSVDGCNNIHMFCDAYVDPVFWVRGGDQGRIQDLWKGGGAQRLPRALQARRFLEGPVWRPSLEFQKGDARPLRPPPESASGDYFRGRAVPWLRREWVTTFVSQALLWPTRGHGRSPRTLRGTLRYAFDNDKSSASRLIIGI